MEHLAGKYSKIKRHLAMRYVRENRGMILEMRRSQAQRRTVIKQETKSEAGVKTETMKNENGTMVKNESAAAEISQEIDATEYEAQFEVMAMGIVADELPHN